MHRNYLALVLLTILTACSENSNELINSDSDGDGVVDSRDAFPHNPLESSDRDGDGIGDLADVFPDNTLEYNDLDGDGIGDNSDPDIDNDGLDNDIDPDIDSDGVANDADNQPFVVSTETGYDYHIEQQKLCFSTVENSRDISCIDRQPLAEAIAVSGDVNFRQCLSNTLNGVTYADEVVQIYCPNLDISAVNGLEAFVRLQSLHLSSNAISHIDLSHNLALTSLSLAGNQLETIDVSHNRFLHTIHLSNNRLEGIDSASNTQLKELHINNNQIKNLDLATNTSLTKLSVRSNQLQSLTLVQNSLLTHLSVSDNQLTDIDLHKNIALKQVSLNNNSLSSVDISHNTALNAINLNQNTLSDFDASHAIALTSLSIMSNALEDVNLGSQQTLHYLNLSNNQLSTIDIDDSPNLTALYLGRNQLSFDSVATDLMRFRDKTAVVDLRENNFSLAVLTELAGLALLSEPYTGLMHDAAPSPTLPPGAQPLLATENIYMARVEQGSQGIDISTAAGAQDVSSYVVATPDASFSLSTIEQGIYFKIQNIDTSVDGNFYVVFTDGNLIETSNYMVGLELTFDQETNTTTLMLGDIWNDDVLEVLAVDLFDKPLALTAMRVDNHTLELKLYDSALLSAPALYTHRIDASSSGLYLDALDRIVIVGEAEYGAESSGINPSIITQYSQPPVEYDDVELIIEKELPLELNTVKLVYVNPTASGDFEFYKVTADDNVVKFADSTFSASSIGENYRYLNGEYLFFIENSSDAKYHLYKMDDAGRQTLLKAFDRGVIEPQFFGYNNHGDMIFSAYTEIAGQELWKTNGSPAGTVMIKDLCPGSCGGIGNEYLFDNGKMYFAGSGPSAAKQLWLTDGSEEGTLKITSDDAFSDIDNIHKTGDYIYVKSGAGFMQIDAADNVRAITGVSTGDWPYFDFGSFFCFEGGAIDDDDYAIICVNHTTLAVEKLSMATSPDSGRIQPIGMLEDKLYFAYLEGDGDIAAYVSSGRDATTRLHSYIVADGSGPANLDSSVNAWNVGDKLVFGNMLDDKAFMFDGDRFSSIPSLLDEGVGPYEYHLMVGADYSADIINKDDSSIYMVLKDYGTGLGHFIKTDLTQEGTVILYSVALEAFDSGLVEFDDLAVFYKYYYMVFFGETYIPTKGKGINDSVFYMLNWQ